MTWSHRDIIDWINQTGRLLPDLHDTAQALGAEMLRAGAPVSRVRLAMRTVHPLTTAVSSIWERDIRTDGPETAEHGLEQRPVYKGSPMEQIARTGKPVRQDLRALTDDDAIAFHELAQSGGTDYFGLPLKFAGPGGAILVFVTDRAEGFEQSDIDGFTAIAAAIATVVEVHRLRGLSTALAEAYLGTDTGARVLGGEITRGHIDRTEAAILLSDIRGWTRLNAERPVEEAVDLANRYFDTMDEAIRASGGEILKFIGDGVLAIFPAADDKQAACRSALEAAQNAQAAAPGLGVEFGVGLHCGSVLYGNIGSASRLDFTVLGQAVNIAARIEALCGRTGQPILYSAEVAELLGGDHIALGPFELKGLEEPAQVFAPRG